MTPDQREIARYETMLQAMPFDERTKEIEKAMQGPLPDAVRAYLRTMYLNLTDDKEPA